MSYAESNAGEINLLSPPEGKYVGAGTFKVQKEDNSEFRRGLTVGLLTSAAVAVVYTVGHIALSLGG